MEVRIENLHFGYNRKREILHGINLTLPGGKFIAVLGPNGCGKTTTVKQINQILKARQGSVYVDGRKVSEMEPSELAKIVAYVPQMTSGVKLFRFASSRGYDYSTAMQAVSRVVKGGDEECDSFDF